MHGATTDASLLFAPARACQQQVPPGSTVKVLLQATSYLGADVSDALITLKWTVPLATGALNVTTDEQGRAVAEIPLGKLPPGNATQVGDTLSLVAEWIGPTRERIVELKSVRIANGPVRTELVRSPATDAPGVPFLLSASTWLNDEDSTQLEGVSVTVSLAPNNSASLRDCPAAAVAQLEQQRCVLVSGKPAPVPPCSLMLPCVGVFKLLACATTYANGSAIAGAGGRPPCSETLIGRNATEWADQPWSALPELRLLKDRTNYTLGSDATISFMNAYWRPATGLLVWGSNRQQKQRVLTDVPPGPNSVSLKVGDECLGGCQVSLVLSLPRPGDAAALAAARADIGPARLALPTSKFFSPLAPATASASVQLRVQLDNRLNVSVSVVPLPSAGASQLPGGLTNAAEVGPDGRVRAVVQPGGAADIVVKVRRGCHRRRPCRLACLRFAQCCVVRMCACCR